MPGENEGVKLDFLEKYIEPIDNNYCPPPAPPGVSAIEVVNMVPNPSYAQFPSMNLMEPPMLEMPPPPTRKVKSAIKQKLPLPAVPENAGLVSLQNLNRSIQAKEEAMALQYSKLEDLINALDTRISLVESKLKLTSPR